MWSLLLPPCILDSGCVRVCTFEDEVEAETKRGVVMYSSEEEEEEEEEGTLRMLNAERKE